MIIGSRTPAQLEDLLEGVGVELSDGVLDRIDEIVPRGTDLNRDDSYCTPPAPATSPCAAAAEAGRGRHGMISSGS
ncbi:hypothetical protein [Streptomyces sp. ISL-1]|uniref:hypothetical protein n=1 Tax=Streptomyces sp. ISL-1 TaxID=2817657 RepID=UPI002034CBE8|nr:hypothetical protein [Streptomyces sp. ISL-1]